MASFGETLAGLRKQKRLTQHQLAERLSDYGFSVTNKIVSNWEKDTYEPHIAQFLAMCDILDVDDILWAFAGIHRGPYAGLNKLGRSKAKDFIDVLFHSDKYRDDPEALEEAPRLLPLYSIGVSAGTGNFLDDSDYDMIAVPENVPASADFALIVSGNSMEPGFRNGQIIWIEQTPSIDMESVGVFYYGDSAYLKQLVCVDGNTCLRSLNSEYSDIVIEPDEPFKVIGCVVA